MIVLSGTFTFHSSRFDALALASAILDKNDRVEVTPLYSPFSSTADLSIQERIEERKREAARRMQQRKMEMKEQFVLPIEVEENSRCCVFV